MSKHISIIIYSPIFPYESNINSESNNSKPRFDREKLVALLTVALQHKNSIFFNYRIEKNQYLPRSVLIQLQPCSLILGHKGYAGHTVSLVSMKVLRCL